MRCHKSVIFCGHKASIVLILIEIWPCKSARPMAHVLLNVKWWCVFTCCLISTENCLRGQELAGIGKRMSVLPELDIFVEVLAIQVCWSLLVQQALSQQMFCRPVDLISPINRIDWTYLWSRLRSGLICQGLRKNRFLFDEEVACVSIWF